MNSIFKITLFCSLLFSGFQTSYSQQIDSLKLDTLISLLTLQLEDERTVDVYNELSNEYMLISDFETALRYSELAKNLAQKIEHKKGELEATCSLGHLYLAYFLDYKKSLAYYDEALLMAQDLESENNLIKIYRGYTYIYAAQGDYIPALSYNTKAIVLAKSLGQNQVVSDLNAYGGSIHEEQGDTLKAMEMFEEVVRIETDYKFVNSSRAALLVVAHYYFLNDEIEKSLDQYRMSLKRFERLQDMRWVSYTHSEMAKVYLADDNLERAEMHGLKGLKIADELSLLKERSDNSYLLANVYRAYKNDALATYYQNMYDSLMASIVVADVSETSMQALNKEAVPNDINGDSSRSIWSQILVILSLIGLSILITGWPSSSKKA